VVLEGGACDRDAHEGLLGIVVLDQDRYDPAGLVVEVYDNPQPALRIEGVLAVEARAVRPRSSGCSRARTAGAWGVPRVRVGA
jgi:hypothetical protein